MSSLVERAHAKVNLYLRVLAQEANGYPNGYHGIETLFQRIKLHDIVRVQVNSGPSQLECTGHALPSTGLGSPTENIAWRAAETYALHTGWPDTWRISIEKNIPVGGGLGGGSADAGAVLRALNQLAPSPIEENRLLELAGGLGADVPFLTSQDSLAWGWSRGNRFVALPKLRQMKVALITFSSGVNTGKAYAAIANARHREGQLNSATSDVSGVRFPANWWGNWKSVIQYAQNDFEQVVLSTHEGVGLVLPKLRELAVELSTSADPTLGMLSGSGATCFLIYSDNHSALVSQRIIHITQQARERLSEPCDIQIVFSQTA